MRKVVLSFLVLIFPACGQGQPGQLCDTRNRNLLNAVETNADFVEYICSNDKGNCEPGVIGSLLDITPIKLTPSGLPSTLSCLITPVRKGKQFPSIVYVLKDSKVTSVLEDWESGLRPLSITNRGYFIIEGRSVPSVDRFEKYRYEWRINRYEEIHRDCYQRSSDGSFKKIGCAEGQAHHTPTSGQSWTPRRS